MTEILISILTNLLELVLTALVIFLGVKLNSWFNDTKVGKKVETFVLAAEKLKETGKITNKPAYVESLLKYAGIEITSEVQAMIEAACERIDLTSVTSVISDNLNDADSSDK